jgi:succinate dehydrogenase / fumarate reductase iron-sulfur subunit
MKITLEIYRFNPEEGGEGRFQKYDIEAEPSDRLLSVLMKIKRGADPSLAFRKSCAHGVCGSDAMVVNGKERLACKTLIKDVVDDQNTTIKVEPLRTLPVQRDLMVDQDRFFDNYMAVKPYLINDEPPPEAERRQSPEERAVFDDGTSCILCASCYSACPVVRETNPRFLGPAAAVQAARFIDDSRDRGFEDRLPALDHPDGLWACDNRFECTRVCPRGIKVTRQINLTRRKIKKHKETAAE